MKSPNDYPQVKFRLKRETTLQRVLTERTPEGTDRALSDRASKDLTDYYDLIEFCLPEFSEYEWLLLAQVVGGWIAAPQTVHLLWAEVQEYLEQQEIDTPDLITRLRQLSRFESWTIYNAIHYGQVPCPDQ